MGLSRGKYALCMSAVSQQTPTKHFQYGSFSALIARLNQLAVVVKPNGIPFWGRCTTGFSTYFSVDWDVHWGYGVLTQGHHG